MATQEKTWNVANRLHSLKDSDNPEVNHIIAGADEIYDDAKELKQSEHNAQTDAALADRYTKSETYSKEQLDNLITTPDVNHVSVVATNATTAVTDILPATGEANTIYRVGNWNGTQYDPTMYSLYAWNGSAYVCLAVRSFVGEVYDVSVNHPDGQGNPTPYADLTAALGTNGANIPDALRKGGMSVKFVQSSDNKYVQYFLTKDEWSANPHFWEKTNLEDELNQIKGTPQELIDLSKDYYTHLYINNSNQWASVSASTDGVLIPVDAGKTVQIITQTTADTYYAQIKNIGNVGTAVEYNGQTNKTYLSANTTNDLLILEDTKYLWICTALYSDMTPQSVKVLAVNGSIQTIENRLSDAESDINDNKSDIIQNSTDIAKINQDIHVGEYSPISSIFVGYEDGLDIGNTIAPNANEELWYIQVIMGNKYRISPSSSGYYGFTQSVPANGVAVTGYGGGSSSTISALTFTAPFDGYLCVGGAKTFNATFYVENSAIGGDVYDLKNRVNANESSISAINQTINDDILEEDEYITIAGTNIDGLDISSVLSPNANENLLYIDVKKGDLIKAAPNKSAYYGFTESVPANGVAVTGNGSGSSSAISGLTLTAPFDGYFCIGGAKTLTATIQRSNRSLTARLSKVEEKDYDYTLPNYIYSSYNDGNPYRNIVDKIRLEGVVDTRIPILLNGGKELPVFSNTIPSTDSATTNLSVTISGNKLKTHEGNIEILTTKTSVLDGKKVIYLPIGDSWCGATPVPNFDGTDKGSWNYGAECVLEAIRCKMDNDSIAATFKTVGRNELITRQAEYKGETFTLRSSDDGRGGWAAQSFLRMPDNVRDYNNGAFGDQAAWDACGCGRKIPLSQTYDESAPYSPFVEDLAHRREYLTTAMGYYHWDYSEALWNALKKNNYNHIMDGAGSYTGSASDKALIDASMEWLLDNPVNPFYDRTVAVSSNGQYAFSLSKWLERYRTMDDNGEHLVSASTDPSGEQVVGSDGITYTIGTKVTTQNLLNNKDIAKPTHVTIELGVNELPGLSASLMGGDIEKIAECCHDLDASIKVGICQVHWPNAFFPGYYAPNAIKRVSNIDILYYWHNKLYPLNAYFVSKYPKDGISNTFYVPTYFIMGVTGSNVARFGYDANGNRIVIGGSDLIHPAIDVYREIGQQIFKWILYTLV